MPLQFAAESENARSMIQSALSRAAARPAPLGAREVDVGAANLTQPHPVYDLRADAIASGGGLAAATQSGVRYIIDQGGVAVAAAEVRTDDAGHATALANLNYGPYVEATQRQLSRLGGASEVQGAAYEARVLRCAAVYLMAVWLRPASGGADLLYPLPPAPAGLEAGRQYSEQELLAAVRPLAERRVMQKDEAKLP